MVRCSVRPVRGDQITRVFRTETSVVADVLSTLKDLGHGTPQKPRPAVPCQQDYEAVGNPSLVDMDQQLLGE